MLDHHIIAQKIREEGSSLKKELQHHVVTYVITGLGVVAALAWNDAIQSLIKFYFPIDQSSVWAKLLYAVIVTAAVVILSVYLTRWFAKK